MELYENINAVNVKLSPAAGSLNFTVAQSNAGSAPKVKIAISQMGYVPDFFDLYAKPS